MLFRSAGGPTVAGTWVSCEEVAAGLVYECDPLTAGQGVARPAMGTFNHEAAMEDPVTRAVYLTEDAVSGRLYKFVPTTAGNFSAGQLYAASVTSGVISWVATSSAQPDRSGTTTAFNGGEGLWIEGRRMYFTTKGDKRVWLVNLDTNAIQVLYDGVVHTPIASLSDDVLTLTFNSLSKSYRSCGYRAGWMVVSGDKKPAADYIEGLNMLSNMRLCANVPGQWAIQTEIGRAHV